LSTLASVSAIRIITKDVAIGWPIETYAKAEAIISLKHASAEVLVTVRGGLPADVVPVNKESNVWLVLELFDGLKCIRRSDKKFAKSVL
jgi:hypothetical protein